MLLWLLVPLACTEPSPIEGDGPAPAAVSVPARPTVPALAPPAPATALTLGAPGARVLRLRDHLDTATLSLPDSNLPSGTATGGRFVLTDGWTRDEGSRRWTHASPVRLPHAFYRNTPPGVRLHRNGAPLPYAARTPEQAVLLGGWAIQDDVLYLTATRDPGDESAPLVLEDDGTARREARMERQQSGLEPVEFARWRATLAGLTREVILLPAPASAEFAVPATADGATLRFGTALAPPPWPGITGRATLRVDADGVEIWRGEAETGGDFQEVRLPIPAGTTRLTLATDPMGDPTGDWAIFAEPELVAAPTPDGPRRVVVVGVDTLRPDHLSTNGYARPTSPGLDAIAAQSLVLTESWAPAPRTRPSFRTALTGRWPLAAIQAPTLGELMADQGFTTAGFVANVHFVPRLGLADGFGSWAYHDSDDAQPQVDRALAWLGEHQTEDALVFLHLMDPHVFYTAPEPHTNRFTGGLDPDGVPEKFNRWIVEGWEEEGTLSDAGRAWMEARYDGEIAYLDQELLRLVGQLDALPGRTVLVLMSDHGEEFWEHGGYEHNHTLYDEVMRVVLWIRPPHGRAGAPLRVAANGSLADIVPTILGTIGVPADQLPDLDGVDVSALLDPDADPSALLAQLEARALPMGHLMFAPERWAVVQGHHKYLLETGSGREELYDLQADPGEHANLAGRPSADLPTWRRTLSEATGFPVEAGWRITTRGAQTTFSLTFPEPVLGAHVIDPEALRDRRANLEWGEIPPVVPDDVATIQTADGGRTLIVTPGREGRGVLAIRGPSDDTVAINQDGNPVRAGGVVKLGGAAAIVTAGTLISPIDSEARRLAEVQDPAAIEALRALGYVQ
jgi:arylsulfatase A-like enzyme